MRIVITGAAGFLGSHLSRYFINKGHSVIGIDNFITGHIGNISDLFKTKKFEFIDYNVTNYIHVSGKVDAVLHFASPASPIDYLKFPIPTLKVGALGTYRALGFAKAKKAIFMIASTSEVYGDPLINPQAETYWGNVNPIGYRGCYSDDTEILTKNGWISFSSVTKNDAVITLNNEGFLEYNRPDEIIKERYKGELIKFSSAKIDLLVTPNHKMYTRKRNSKNFELIEAFQSIRWERSEMLKNGKWKGKENEWFYLPLVKNSKSKQIEKIKMDIWLEFFGYFITEGCSYLRNRTQIINKKTYFTKVFTVLISQSKKSSEKRNKIRECLKKLGFKYYEENAQFKILSKQLYTHLKQFGKSKQKYIPKEFLMLSQRQLQILFNAMMLGDGSWDKRKYYSSSPNLLNNMQEILLKIGMCGTIKEKDKEKGTYTIFILSDKKKDFLTPQYPKRKIEKYDGYVYCVNVPNHIIYVRRNGIPLWCGNCYDEAKRYAEALTMAYHRYHQMPVRIVRIFNTYGPNMRLQDGRAVPNFMVQALKNKPITVYGKGKQTRSLCYVSDLISGIYKLLQSNINTPVNIGNPHEVSILELAQTIKKLTKSKSRIIFKPLPQDDPQVRRPDISIAKSKLEWQPKISLEEGLKETVKYFKKAL